MNLYSQSDLAGRIARIVRVAGRVDQEIHTCLCSILSHTMNYGDYTQILPLMNGLTNAVRKQGIAAWVKNFSGGQLVLKLVGKKKDQKWTAALADGWSKDKFDLPGAILVKFGDFTPEPAPSVFDMEKLIDMLNSKVSSKDKNADGTFKVSVGARDLAAKVLATIMQNGWNDPKLIEADKLITQPVSVSVTHKVSAAQGDALDKKELTADAVDEALEALAA